jgi:Sap, sulfolipid-1-addressing protein
MNEGISTVLAFAVGVAISPVPIIAVILMLFSQRARINGPLFMAGWMVALALVSGLAYYAAVQGGASTSTSTDSATSWGKILFGILFLIMAVRTWRKRPAPGTEAPMPKWMAGIDALKPGKALTFGLILAGLNVKNLLLSLAAGAGLAALGLSTGEAVGSLVVFVAVGSLTIAGPVVWYLLGGEKAKTTLNELKGWLAAHNDAVMAVLFLVFGVDLISKGLAG